MTMIPFRTVRVRIECPRMIQMRPSINSIVKKMLNEKKPIQAFLLFGLSLSEAEREEAGFVFNKRFNLLPNGSVFDWQLPNLPGVGSKLSLEQAAPGTLERLGDAPFRRLFPQSGEPGHSRPAHPFRWADVIAGDM